MRTIVVIALYAVVGTLGGWVVSFLANLAGGLGALIGSLGRLRNLSGIRKGVALVFCFVGQTYVFLAWVAFVVAYTTLLTKHQPVVSWPVWVASFYAAMVPVIAASGDSTREEKENPELKQSVASIALSLSVWFDGTAVFLFAFWPALMPLGWRWVPYVNAAQL